MRSLEERALTILLRTFKGRVDRLGRPLVLHSLRVGLRGTTPEEIAAGFLHDVLEDAPGTSLDGMPGAVVDAVNAVTRHQSSYASFIEHIARSGPLAVAVKLHDLHDNLARVHEIPDRVEAERLRQRYAKAVDRLWSQGDTNTRAADSIAQHARALRA